MTTSTQSYIDGFASLYHDCFISLLVSYFHDLIQIEG